MKAVSLFLFTIRFSLILACWNEEPEQRPLFVNIVQQISATLEQEAGYVDFSRSLSWKKQPAVQGRKGSAGIKIRKDVQLEDVQVNAQDDEEHQYI